METVDERDCGGRAGGARTTSWGEIGTGAGGERTTKKIESIKGSGIPARECRKMASETVLFGDRRLTGEAGMPSVPVVRSEHADDRALSGRWHR